MKVAIIVENIDRYSTGVKVACVMWEMFPQADVYTRSYDKEKLEGTLWKEQKGVVRVCKGNIIPFEKLDLSSYDLVFSIGSSWAKSVITRSDSIHINYAINTNPLIWEYVQKVRPLQKGFKKRISPIKVSFLRILDRIDSDRPDFYIASCKEIKRKIQKYYRRSSIIIFPPIDIKVQLDKEKVENKYFLYVGSLERHKKIENIIKAFNSLGYKLMIVGSGDEEYVESLRKLCKVNVNILLNQSDYELKRHYLNSRGLIYTTDDNFSSVAIEQQAYGKGVIGYRYSSVCDLVVENLTGILYDDLSVKSIKNSVKSFINLHVKESACVENAYRYNREWFKKYLQEYLISLKIYEK